MALELAPGGSSGSVVHANPGGVPVAEAGLSNYINWSAGHGVQNDTARTNVQRTMAGMGNEQWTGEFLTLAQRMAENYATGARLAGELNAMLVRCQDIRTAYKRNEGAGSRESILS